MSGPPVSPNDGIPDDWDLLLDPPSEEKQKAPSTPHEGRDIRPRTVKTSRSALALASWAELAVLVAPCATALAAVRIAGYTVSLGAIPWAGMLALGWWFLATSALLFVRRATAGMLGAGLRFHRPIPPRRLVVTAIAALAAACLAGVLAVLGARWWPPSVAAGSPAEPLSASAA